MTHTTHNIQHTLRRAWKMYRSIEKRMIVMLLALLLVFGVVYIYFVGLTITYAVLQRDAQASIAKTHTELSLRESDYLVAAEAIHRQRAQELGLVAVTEKHFAQRSVYLGRADTQ